MGSFGCCSRNDSLNKKEKETEIYLGGPKNDINSPNEGQNNRDSNVSSLISSGVALAESG